MPLIPRLHLFELTDQSFVPGFVRGRVQSYLTLLWLFRVPVLQADSPASLVSQTLHTLLGPRAPSYTYVDFCAGAGGPTPWIAEQFNAILASSKAPPRRSPRTPNGSLTNGSSWAAVAAAPPTPAADFVLTDIAPHLGAWRRAAARNGHVHYVASSVDAAAFAPADLAARVTLSPLAEPGAKLHGPTFRLFFLAFHHMPDALARRMLADALRSSDGFAIFELQGRTPNELLMTMLLLPLTWILTPFFFWRDPLMWLFGFFFPVIPAIVAFDGIVSCLRTREPTEIETLISQSGAGVDNWRFRDGAAWHTWPLGKVRWFVGVKE